MALADRAQHSKPIFNLPRGAAFRAYARVFDPDAVVPESPVGADPNLGYRADGGYLRGSRAG